MDVSSGRMPAT